jgi:hypothetical protein
MCQVWPPAPKHHIKRQGEGRERRFITRVGTCPGKCQSSTQLIFSHLRDTDVSYRLEDKRTEGRGQRYPSLNSLSHRCDLLTIISVLTLGEVPKSLSGGRQAVHPKEGLLLAAVSVPCHENVIVCLSWNPR